MPQSFQFPQHVEALVQQTRQTFGETVPKDFLSPDELRLYERWYGVPLYKDPGNIGILVNLAQQELEARQEEQNALLREDEEGNLEHIEYVPDAADSEEAVGGAEELAEDGKLVFQGSPGANVEDVEADLEPEHAEANQPGSTHHDVTITMGEKADFGARLVLFKDIAAAQQAQAAFEREQRDQDVGTERDEGVEEEEIDNVEMASKAAMEDIERDHEVAEIDEELEGAAEQRTHPLTALARSGTTPSTIFLPKEAIADPVQALLRGSSKKHLTDVAVKTFGGPSLPDSVATPPKKGLALHQKPVALAASQSFMGEMEGNAYLAAIMPGMYASVMNILVEVRKRLGSDWLRGLLHSPDTTRILDAGSGGAAIQAWRELLKAESELADGGVAGDQEFNGGKATVVTGSDILRHRVSRLLQNTTFLPRLPDYTPARDHPTLGYGANPQPRKQYDVIVAPHTLWHFKEDWMRKAHVQNLWSLLKPDGGVLILLEKGLPRGFELIAGAREVLLRHHIEGSDLHGVDHQAPGTFEEKANTKEKGMIIAPCTNHSQCPMYTSSGHSKGRKDLCHFSQRFIRPPYLQRLLASNHGNHEDIRFSYLAVQRGGNLREGQNIVQGDTASEEAFAGFEDTKQRSLEEEQPGAEIRSPFASPVSPLSLPRTILPPIKRRGHVILDLCTPGAKIERWTVPKSFSKQAYRDARKSKWGDLWALGAKTRIHRNIRLGRTSEKTIQETEDDPTSEEIEGPVKEFQKTRRKSDDFVRGKERGKRRRLRNMLEQKDDI